MLECIDNVEQVLLKRGTRPHNFSKILGDLLPVVGKDFVDILLYYLVKLKQ